MGILMSHSDDEAEFSWQGNADYATLIPNKKCKILMVVAH